MKTVDVRQTLAVILLVAGIVTGVAGVLTAYVRDTLIDSDEAAERAVTAIARPEVSRLIATVIVDQVVDAGSDSLGIRPVLVSLLSEAMSHVVEAPEFRAIVAGTIRDVHRAVLYGDTDTFTVQLSDLAQTVKQQVAALEPELGAKIPDDLDDTLIDMRSDPRLLRIVQITGAVRVLPFVLLLVSLACLGGSILAARNRRRAWAWAGAGVVSVGGIILAGLAATTWLILRQFEEGPSREAAGAVWSVFTSDLNDWAVVVAIAGAMMATAAWWVSGPADLGERLWQFRRLLAPPDTIPLRLIWVASWLAVGVFAIVAWENALWVALRVVVTAAGVVFVVGSLAELLRLVDRGRRERP